MFYYINMKEKVIIVDKNDNIIGEKYRHELDDTIDIIRVSGIWIENEKGELLLAQRSFDKKHDPGKWGPAAAGTIEVGETYESNILKEIEEEIGVFLELKDIVDTGTFFYKTSHQFFSRNFYANINSKTKFTLQESEVASIKWVTWDFLTKDILNNSDNYISSLKGGEGIVKQIKEWKNKKQK